MNPWNKLNLEHIHRHSKKVLQSDIGIIFGALLCATWFIYQLVTHKSIEVPAMVTMLGFFLVLFIERAHGREMKAIHLKLDELIAAQEGASNRLIRVEEAPESVLHSAHDALKELAEQKEPHESVSIDQTDFFCEIDAA